MLYIGEKMGTVTSPGEQPKSISSVFTPVRVLDFDRMLPTVCLRDVLVCEILIGIPFSTAGTGSVWCSLLNRLLGSQGSN